MSMNAEGMERALDAIHDEALKLMQFDLPEEAQQIVELIHSLSRYKYDIRSDQERQSKDISE